MEHYKNLQLDDLRYFSEHDLDWHIEQWNTIKDYPNYKISDLGRVKSLCKSKAIILVQSNGSGGYKNVGLYENGIMKTKYVHKLVSISFLDHIPCEYELVINHKNFIRTDNRVENLEITTPRDNSNAKHLKSSSKYTGVHWCKRQNKWIATILINKKKKYIGQFKNEIDASIAYENKLKTIL